MCFEAEFNLCLIDRVVLVLQIEFSTGAWTFRRGFPEEFILYRPFSLRWDDVAFSE